jgi:hypothetical protein
MGEKRTAMKIGKGGKLAKNQKSDLSSFTNKELIVMWFNRQTLNRQSRLALKKEMRVRRVTTGGFYTL